MKPVALWLCAFLVLGLAAGAVAQTATQSPANQADTSGKSQDAIGQQADASGTTRDMSRNPNVDATGAVKTDRSTNPTPSDRGADVNANVDKRDRNEGQDGGSALPRSAAGDGRSTIFGLSPAAAAVIGAALLVVVILAIVSMSRGGESTYIDREPRI
jgi:cobalamin biosynthesis Mg chelatase CobN